MERMSIKPYRIPSSVFCKLSPLLNSLLTETWLDLIFEGRMFMLNLNVWHRKNATVWPGKLIWYIIPGLPVIT